MRLDALLSELGPKVREALSARQRGGSPAVAACCGAGSGGTGQGLRAAAGAAPRRGAAQRQPAVGPPVQDGARRLGLPGRGVRAARRRASARWPGDGCRSWDCAAAQLYLRSAAAAGTEEAELYVLVDEAPLGAMEAELFERQRRPRSLRRCGSRTTRRASGWCAPGTWRRNSAPGPATAASASSRPSSSAARTTSCGPACCRCCGCASPRRRANTRRSRARSRTPRRGAARRPELAAWMFDVPVRATTIFQARRVPHKPVTAETEPAPPPRCC